MAVPLLSMTVVSPISATQLLPFGLQDPRRLRAATWALIIAGTLFRLYLAFRYIGVSIDINAWALVADSLRADPLHVYRTVNGNPPLVNLWPYPPGFFPWNLTARFLSHHLPGTFAGWVKLPMVLADAGIAWVVQNHLGLAGRGARARLAGCALVALGPPFFVISGYHGQIDSVAILPALLAVSLWSRPGVRRPLLCGLLIGIGAAVKTVPLVVVLALLPTAETWRERALIAVPAVLVPAVLFVPFFIADPGPIIALGNYQSRPGLAGLSMLMQPSFVHNFFQTATVYPNATTEWLTHHGGLPAAAGLALVSPLLVLRRTPPADAAVVIWLTTYALLGGFLFQYLVWGLPFFLLAGHLRVTAAFMVALCIPLAVVYFRLHSRLDIRVYQVVSIGIYLATAATWAVVCARLARPGTPQQAVLRRAGATS